MYNINPVFPLGDGQIHSGFESLARRISREKTVIIDGYQGIFFDAIRKEMERQFENAGIDARWQDAGSAMLPSAGIDKLIEPFLGGDDPLFGTRCTLSLKELFDEEKLKILKPDRDSELNIIYGPGASLAGWKGCLIYIDLPKNEMQYRARKKLITNLGAAQPEHPKAMYKRFYFVDWVLLNKHKDELSGKVDIAVDVQDEYNPTWMEGHDLRKALHQMSRNVFRVKPWFEPGAWGGTWIKDHIPGLRKDVPNYAWSFEMIVPENGLVMESSGNRLEVSFDWLMFSEGSSVLGDCHERFGKEFPIRFDFLDTFDGGSLSVQCHPQEEFIQKKFGENYTQQEAYYILDTKDNALVNLGFTETIDHELFKKDLEISAREKTQVHIAEFVQQHPASKHDFFLIPEGTVHGSGANNLVLEISTTPYIFTFKMYDWLRLDLEGNPRDLNIDRAFENLDFSRKGEIIRREFISHPQLLEEGSGWKKFHLPTHALHYYDVWRYHIITSAFIETNNKCHVLNLVEGENILVETENGMKMQFSYAETFTIPAAAGSYTVRNLGTTEAMIVIAFIK
ncbi:MAG: class I mannose-6-phosphate isomerase [Bacteroidetes bacterium]|nr:class I mannose-6-phosphate isomerase [Bacteroidota bacterium]